MGIDPDRRVALVAAALLLAATAVGAAPADDYPPIRSGLWRFHRTVEDPAAPGSMRVLEHEKCADPVADMKAMHEKLVKVGCTFSPVEREGNVYRFTATCELEGGARAVSRTVLTYHTADSYDAVVDAGGIAGSPSGETHEALEARRVGDCP